MAFRGRGRGRGFGGGFRHVKRVPFELFPEVEDLGTAKYSEENLQLIRWGAALKKFSNASPYFYQDDKATQHPHKVQKPDIERYSDRNLHTSKAKAQLWDFIPLDPDHVPAELARDKRKEKRVSKRVRWNQESDLQKLDILEKLELKNPGQEGNEKKENEEEEEDGENVEEEGEFSDEGDYEQAEDFDDDEDDFNMADDNNDEPFY